MRLTSTRTITVLFASATLAGGMLAVGASTTATAHPVTDTSPAGARPGDVRVWEAAHAGAALDARILPGDVRVWELKHPASLP